MLSTAWLRHRPHPEQTSPKSEGLGTRLGRLAQNIYKYVCSLRQQPPLSMARETTAVYRLRAQLSTHAVHGGYVSCELRRGCRTRCCVTSSRRSASPASASRPARLPLCDVQHTHSSVVQRTAVSWLRAGVGVHSCGPSAVDAYGRLMKRSPHFPYE